MLKHRLITGSLLIASILLIAFLDHDWTAPHGTLHRGLFLGIITCGLVAPLLALELGMILTRLGSSPLGWLTCLGSALIAGCMWLCEQPGDTVLLMLSLVFTLAFIFGAAGRRTRGLITDVMGTLFVTFTSGVLLGFWLMLRDDQTAWVLVGAILTVKMADIGAYTVGCSIGRNRLIPWLSPKKTWEGLAGGIVFSALCGTLLAWASPGFSESPEGIPLMTGFIFGVLCAVIGLLGDLSASALKRDSGIKDSGSLLPGLGGLVDTLDSLLLVGPVAWLMLS